MQKIISNSKKLITLFLTLALLLGIVISLTAEKVSAETFGCAKNVNKVVTSNFRFSFITGHTCRLSISSSGSAAVFAQANANSQTTQLDLLVKLQRYVNGRWTTIAIFESSGKRFASINESYNLSSMGSYRILSTATANSVEVSQITDSATY